MRVLITGGFGYLGGRLALFLAEQAEYDILLGGRSPVRSVDWLPQATPVQTDWQSVPSLERICAGVDAVVHLSGMNAQDCAADPAAALEVNGGHTAKLLRAADRQGVKRFIYLSSAHVYGSPLQGTITEDTHRDAMHPYATSCLAGEDEVRAAQVRGDVEGVVIRLSNGYGAPVHVEADCWTLLVNDLCRQAATAGRMELRSSGLQRRDFIPLEDACRAIDHLLQLRPHDLGQVFFNLGGQWAPTVWDMACLVQQRCEVVLSVQP
ncbi:MAG TPA: SDR family oxidoreductase, partial [Candidatus Latescibacteria bacterium]|nr:SDR family oxidoreductase [Candidatus Latescibacterota bacterium]